MTVSDWTISIIHIAVLQGPIRSLMGPVGIKLPNESTPPRLPPSLPGSMVALKMAMQPPSQPRHEAEDSTFLSRSLTGCQTADSCQQLILFFGSVWCTAPSHEWRTPYVGPLTPSLDTQVESYPLLTVFLFQWQQLTLVIPLWSWKLVCHVLSFYHLLQKYFHCKIHSMEGWYSRCSVYLPSA